MLLFVKPRVLKDELNARFREEHPSLPPSLTLSKIRSVKRQALLGCHRAVSARNMHAFVYDASNLFLGSRSSCSVPGALCPMFGCVDTIKPSEPQESEYHVNFVMRSCVNCMVKSAP